ncbi:MAG: tolB [Chthonomonadaceae bacterium]|nr:tolB [Chthonomonadaceae bacterium]
MQTFLSTLATLAALAAVTHPALPVGQMRVIEPDYPRNGPGWKLGHTRVVNDIAYSRDGKIVVSASDDGSIRLWDAGNGALLKTIVGDTKGVTSIRFSPDGASLASGGWDRQVRVWSMPDGRLLHTLSGQGNIVGTLAWSPTRTLLASGSYDGKIVLWNPATGQRRTLHSPLTSVNTLAFSPHGDTLTVGGWIRGDKSLVAVYDVRTGYRQQNWLTRSGFSRMDFSPQGDLVAIYERKGKTTLRDASIGHVRRTFRSGSERAPHIVFSPDGTKFLVSSDESATKADIVQVWDLKSSASKSGKFDLGDNEVQALSPDGSRFAAVTRAKLRNRVFVCDSLTGRELWASADPSLILSSKPSLALLERLSEDYRAYGLPTVPKAAYLAYIEPRKMRPNQEVERYLALVLPPAHPKEEPTYYAGLYHEEVSAEQTIRAVPADQASLKGTAKVVVQSEILSFSSDCDLMAAIQMQERGWTPLAMMFLERALTDYRGDARRDLAVEAWQYWNKVLVKPDTDRKIALSSLQILAQTEFLQGDAGRRALLKDLEATLAPTRAAAGSIGAEIDALVDCQDRTQGVPSKLSEADLRFRKLWLRGFEAVPVLLKYTEDRRLTRMESLGMGRASSYIIPVGEVVARLLAGLAGSEAAVGFEMQEKFVGMRANRAKAEHWWKQASALGEETYLIRHVLPDKNSEQSWPNSHNAVLIAARYPKHLPELYREMLNRYPHAVSWQIADLLQESPLSDAEKVPLLLRAAASGDAQQRLGAFWPLVAMKRPETAPILVARLDSLPATPPVDYWRCEASGLALIVQTLDDPRAWAALERLAKRSDVGQRLEIITEFGNISVAATPKRHRVEFLAKFLQDRTLRVIPGQQKASPASGGKYSEGVYADHDMPRITIQDSALRQIAYLIGMEDNPDATWTKEEWDTWRQNTLQALQRYLAHP